MGLQQLQPGDEGVPGMTPCACVQFVRRDEGERAVAGGAAASMIGASSEGATGAYVGTASE